MYIPEAEPACPSDICCGQPSQSQLARHLLWTSVLEPACTTSIVDIGVSASLHVICCEHPCKSQLARHLFWTSVLEPACTSSGVDIRVSASLHVICCGHLC
ncbi:hypothetical protein DPMN_079442 [Dreissena polymorpha]|uniref:Uncharacterized protein n=1 Tax=Dreissena polymorpha TaxID=45954 RepID=A0A9D4BSZ8_DREPO|nr:hypothetical protein DPMN_079442 [Dreissena polymorpha]